MIPSRPPIPTILISFFRSQISGEIQVKKQQRSSRKGDKGTQDEGLVLVSSPSNSQSIPSDQSSVSLVITKKRRKSAGGEKKNEMEDDVEEEGDKEGSKERDKEGGDKKSGLNPKNTRKLSSGTQSTISSDEQSENEEGEEEEELVPFLRV